MDDVADPLARCTWPALPHRYVLSDGPVLGEPRDEAVTWLGRRSSPTDAVVLEWDSDFEPV